MTEPIDLSRSIFEDPPDGLGEEDFYFGTFAVGLGSMDGIEVARAFAEAGDRLLAAAWDRRESWEAAYPVLFCYRHALELYLKAVIPEGGKKNHGLDKLWTALYAHMKGRYKARDIRWLCARILEFHSLDPRSTAFRYHDSVPDGHPELWVDFDNLKRMIRAVFWALERIRIRSFNPAGDIRHPNV